MTKILFVALGFVMSLTFAMPVQAEFRLADGLELKDALGIARNLDSGDNPNARGGVFGIYSGSPAGYYKVDPTGTKPDYKLFGFGGVTMYASTSLADGSLVWVPTFTPISIFNDTFHVDIGKNLNDESPAVVFGFSGTVETLNLMMDAAKKATASVTGP